MAPSERFDLDDFRLTGSDLPAAAPKSRKPPRHRPGGTFLKGPIPWPWLEAAGRLPGRALALSLILWQQAGCDKKRTVRVNLTRLPLGIGRQGGQRALRALEAAGLVAVLRQPGRGADVTILDGPDPGA